MSNGHNAKKELFDIQMLMRDHGMDSSTLALPGQPHYTHRSTEPSPSFFSIIKAVLIIVFFTLYVNVNTSLTEGKQL
jgi:hypothetical protein